MLYFIEILHQTTTRMRSILNGLPLYFIEILHQTTTKGYQYVRMSCCILLKFYIKPQRRDSYVLKMRYLQSFSNSINSFRTSDEVDSMRFSLFQRTKIRYFFRIAPTVGEFLVWIVRFCPKNSVWRHIVYPLRQADSYNPTVASSDELD